LKLNNFKKVFQITKIVEFEIHSKKYLNFTCFHSSITPLTKVELSWLVMKIELSKPRLKVESSQLEKKFKVDGRVDSTRAKRTVKLIWAEGQAEWSGSKVDSSWSKLKSS